MRPFRRLLVAAATAALALAGCTDPASVAEEPTPGEERTVHLYGTDGTMQNSFAAEFADQTLLRGMKGTAPLNQMPTVFTNRLREVDPELTDFLFAGETYDAVVISALAAELAGTPDPEVVRTYITTVTTGGEPCETVADCLELAADGTDLAYQGVSLRRGGLTDLGQPATASYATLHFGADGLLDDAKTEFVGSGDPTETTTAEPPEPGPRPTGPQFQIEPLTFGGLLPETGDLSLAYPPMIAGAQLAVSEINDAGGVFGVDVEWIDGDTETSPKVAGQVLASHIEDGVHVIIGPAASSEAEAIMADAVAAKRIMFSPSNTEASLSNADHDGYYFRTAPSDELQGAALADIILRDGVARVTIVARDDAYGRGLQANARNSLLGFGVPTSDLQLLTYGVPEEDGAPVPGLADLVDQIIAGRPDGVLVIGFGEAAQVIQRMADQGLRPTP